MLTRLRRGYLKLRTLPRYVVTSLDGIAAAVAGLRQQRDASFLHNTAALGDIHADITGFCDEATRLMLSLRAASEAQTVQAAQAGQRVRAVELSLHELSEQLAAERAQSAAERAQSAAERNQAAERAQGAAERTAALEARLTALAAAIETFRTDPPAAPDLAALAEHAGRQAAALAHLGAVSAEQARIFPSWLWKPEVAEGVRAILARLAPQAVPATPKIRVGRDHDGGYVMLDDFVHIAGAVSGGIADDVSWDLNIAGRGIPVAQFDPSVAAAPQAHELCRFERLRLAERDGPDAVSLDTVVATRMAHSDGPLLLKIDIEGDEWAVLGAAGEATLARFRQIVCEFHGLERLGEEAFARAADAVFAKLGRSHFVHHVHGNNCANFANVGNVVVPQSLEVSFARRADYEAVDDPGLLFPTPLDRPNQPDRADLTLGNFRFGAAATGV